jgi:hypothetical protein
MCHRQLGADRSSSRAHPKSSALTHEVLSYRSATCQASGTATPQNSLTPKMRRILAISATSSS